MRSREQRLSLVIPLPFPSSYWSVVTAMIMGFMLSNAAAVDKQWHEETGYRWRELPKPPGGKVGFTRLMPEATGIYFTNEVSDLEIAQNRMLADGSGVAVGDFDRDGL